MSKTRLLAAVRGLDLKEAAAILAEKPELLDARDPQGRSLLHLACAANHRSLQVPASHGVRMVELLTKAGLDPRPLFVTPSGKTLPSVNAVWFAAAWGKNHDVIKLLVKRGA